MDFLLAQSIGINYAQTGAGWLISPQFRPNEELFEVLYKMLICIYNRVCSAGELMKVLSILLASILITTGCTHGVLLSTSDTDATYDGLVRKEKSTIQNVWIKTGIDLSSYTRYQLDVDLEFQIPRGGDANARTREFMLVEVDRQSLTEVVENTFRQELLKSVYFRESPATGPDVIRMHIRLIDIVALMPENPDQGAGTNMDFESTSALYISSVGEATLVGEVFDSITGEIIARFVERRAARQSVGGAQGSRASGWREIIPGIERWGRIVREHLDEIYDL